MSNDHDETAAAYFKSGWDAAVREVAVRIECDRLDEFMQEQRRVAETF